jgi:hypothetical protein
MRRSGSSELKNFCSCGIASRASTIPRRAFSLFCSRGPLVPGVGHDNPFAYPPPQRTLRRTTLRTAVLLAGCIAAVFVIRYGSQWWLLQRLTSRFDAQPAAVQIERLDLLAQLGTAGLPPLVSALDAENPQVAAAANAILRRELGQWHRLPPASADGRRRILVQSLARIADRLADPARRWAAALLNQTLLDTLQSTSDDGRIAFQQATELLGSLSAWEEGDPRLASHSPLLPLPRSSAAMGLEEGDDEADDSRWEQEASLRIETTPRVLPVAPMGTIPTLEPPDASLAENASGDSQTVAWAYLESEQHLSPHPLAAYATRSVIDWMSSVQPERREAAEEELQRRGFSDADLQLAQRLASTDHRVREALIEELPHRDEIDPRPWLLWLAADPERDLRLQAIAVLGTMDDPQVQSDLRELMVQERDPAVASRLRRVLGLR